MLKEYIARGTYIFPPKASLRLISDIFAYCKDELPRWNTISISGYHMAEAGATPAQEIAFTLADAIEYVRAAQRRRALAPTTSARGCRSSSWPGRRCIEEVAKFRAARRVWAKIMKETFGATNPKSLMLRFHTQTAGVQLTAQQPEVNLVRVALQGLGAVLGGTQSLHTNSFDEAIALPTAEGGPARAAHPAGHRLRDRRQQDGRPVRRLVRRRVPHRRARGRDRAADPGRRGPRRRRRGDRAGLPEGRDRAVGVRRSRSRSTTASASVVGVNKFTIDEEEPYEPLRVDPAIEAEQKERLASCVPSATTPPSTRLSTR